MNKAINVYWKWLCKSYTDQNNLIKWCPSIGCKFCISLDLFAVIDHSVKCDCGVLVCTKCSKYSHVPVDCNMASIWELKNNQESENINWILSHCKPCPNKECGS